MATLRKVCFVVLGLFYHISIAESSSAQYCHSQTAQEPIPFCVVTQSTYNTTSQATDLAVTFAYQKSPYGGWGAIGLGNGMYGGLMFVTYGEKSKEDDLILSVRAGKGHFEPRPSEAVPVVHTLRSSMNESRWVEISFLCLDFESWTGKEPGTGERQPWLWAFNTVQSLNEATKESSLAAHDHYGYFSLRMMGHNLDEETDGSIIPNIDPSLPNQGGDDGGFEDRKSPSTWVKTHGSLLVLGLMILYPCGAFVIRSGSKRSFKGHLIFQSLASVSCLAGATVALYFVDLNSLIHSRIAPHMLIGMAVLFLIPLQFLLGYLHHRAFLFSLKNTMITKSHTWIGRLLVLGGCVNTILGQWLIGASALKLIFIGTVSCIDLCVLVGLYYISSQERDERTTTTTADEDDTPFLRYDSCKNDFDSDSTNLGGGYDRSMSP